jgi:hypothetical protein
MNRSLKERFHAVDLVPSPWDEATPATSGGRVVLDRRERRPRSAWTRPFAASIATAALVVGLVILLPTFGGGRASDRAFAVTDNGDGTVTVEIASIEHGEELESRLRELGVPTEVYLLPSGNLCSPKGQKEGSPPLSDRREEMRRQRLDITENADGSFVFTVDRSRLLPGYTLAIYMQYVAESGASGSTKPLIMPEYTSSDVSRCELVDGEVSGF